MKKVGEYEKTITNLKIADEEIREDFARIFGRKKENTIMSYRNDSYADMSWRTIFSEVGRILERGDITEAEKELVYTKNEMLRRENELNNNK